MELDFHLSTPKLVTWLNLICLLLLMMIVQSSLKREESILQTSNPFRVLRHKLLRNDSADGNTFQNSKTSWFFIQVWLWLQINFILKSWFRMLILTWQRLKTNTGIRSGLYKWPFLEPEIYIEIIYQYPWMGSNFFEVNPSLSIEEMKTSLIFWFFQNISVKNLYPFTIFVKPETFQKTKNRLQYSHTPYCPIKPSPNFW